MDTVLQQEIAGSPVTVTLRGEEYPLAYPMRAVILYKQLTGDNLFQGGCWQKIAPMEDPERFIACLWAGLHRYDWEKQAWVEPFTREQLQALVDFGNVNPACEAITKALTSFFPKAKDGDKGESELPVTATAGSEEWSLPISGPAPASTSV
jgi:hypothetical protein